MVVRLKQTMISRSLVAGVLFCVACSGAQRANEASSVPMPAFAVSAQIATDQPQAPWSLTAVIGPACLPRHGVECRSCGDFCDARAIRFAPRIGGSPLPEIDRERCTGCGACVAPCPVTAITMGG